MSMSTECGSTPGRSAVRVKPSSDFARSIGMKRGVRSAGVLKNPRATWSSGAKGSRRRVLMVLSCLSR